MSSRFDTRGVTLIELIFSIVLIGIIGVIAAQVFLFSTRSVLTGNQVREATQVNRIAMDRMVREIRNVRGPRCVAAADPNTFTFVDGDNTTISFGIVAGSLVRNGDVLVNNATGPVFSYFNNTGADITAGPPLVCGPPNTCSNTLCAATNIWTVQIDLTTVSGTESMRLRSRVHPRNF